MRFTEMLVEEFDRLDVRLTTIEKALEDTCILMPCHPSVAEPAEPEQAVVSIDAWRKLIAEHRRLQERVAELELSRNVELVPAEPSEPVVPSGVDDVADAGGHGYVAESSKRQFDATELSRMQARLVDLEHEKTACEDAQLAREAEIDELRRRLG